MCGCVAPLGRNQSALALFWGDESTKVTFQEMGMQSIPCFALLQMKIPAGATNEVDSCQTQSTSSSTPSTPGGISQTTPIQDWTDEPIHIINVSLKYEDMEGWSDTQITKKCHQFVQVTSMWASCDHVAIYSTYHVTVV